MAFGRVVRLFVGNFALGNMDTEDAKRIDGLDIEFSVTRSIEFWDNAATITLYNPSPDTLRYVMRTGASVILQAGHEDETVGNIFVGQIARVETHREGPDIVTAMTCKSARGAYYQLVKLSCDVRFRKGSTFRECLQYMADYAGVALRAGADLDALDGALSRNFQASGSFPGVFENFVRTVLKPEAKLGAFFDNNEILILGENNHVEIEHIALYYDTGLLSASEIRDEGDNDINGGGDAYHMMTGIQELEKKYRLDEHAPKVQEVDRKRRVRFRAILSPKFCPNARVELDSTTGDSYDSVLAVQGLFSIDSVEFNGGTTGSDFTVECEAVEVTE